MDNRNPNEHLSFDEAKQFWDNLDNTGYPDVEMVTEQEAKEFRQKLYARIEAYEAKKRRRKIIRYTSLTVAATLVFISSIIVYRSFYLPDVYEATKHALTITLKDGSKVTLSKGAKLTVEKSFPSDTRDVVLQGDAVFTITKSKKHPFIVHAGAYQTKVLGTIFKITQRNTKFNVDLFEGKVQVIKTEKPAESFVIHPKETFSNLGSKNIATIIATKNTIDNTTHNTATLSMTDIKLEEAVNILESTFGIDIQYPANIANTIITITKENATADDLIRLISLKLNLHTKKINDKIFELED